MNTVKKIFTVGVVFTTILWTVGFAAFVPVAQAASAGDLIKASGAAVYYYAADGKRYVFPNETTYKSWYSDFSSVVTITDSELAAISIGGNVTMRPGTNLVKITTDPKVYAVTDGGTLHWVETESLAQTLYGSDWASRVVDVPDAFFVNYTTGGSVSSAVHPDGSLIKYEGSADIYLVEDGKKRKVADDAAFSANRFQESFILTIPDTVTYSNGSDVTGEESDLTTVSGTSTGTTATGTLSVALAGDTPAAGSVAQSVNANFTKLVFTAGGSDVDISKIYVTRTGLSANTDVENIKLINMEGTYVGNIGSLGSNNKASITFATPLTIEANTSESYYIRAGVTSGATTNNNIQLGFASASDIVTDASVSGSFPLYGNTMSIVGTTVGTATIAQDGTTVDSTPDVGDENVVVNKFKFSSSATEGFVIESLTFLKAGTTGNSDTGNIDLFSVTDNKVLGTISNWDSEGKATFGGLNVNVAKGETHRFRLQLDILDGASLTVNADLIDGSDTLASVKGSTYGFYLTPSISGSWNGKGSSDQTINGGSLSVSKSSATAPTGNIAPADDQELGTFDFEAKGEPVNVTSLTVSFDMDPEGDSDTTGFDVDNDNDATDGDVTTTDLGQISNVRVYDENGEIIAGPQDLTAYGEGSTSINGGTYHAYATFSDLFTVPVGVAKYTVKAKLGSDTASGDDVRVAIADSDTDVTAKGYNTNTSINPTPSATEVEGNTQTIRAGTLSATTLTTPALRNVVPGAQDIIWMEGSLSAANSGEAVLVDTIVLEDSEANSGNSEDLDNFEIWADLDGNGSYETKVTSTTSWGTSTGANADETLSFTLTDAINVPKDGEIRVAAIGDLAVTGPTAGEDHYISFDTDSGDVSGTGADTGSTVNATPAGTGQRFRVANYGALTVAVDASSPSKALLEGKSSKQTVAVFKLTETSAAEDLELDSFKITDSGADTVANKYYLYASARQDGGSVSDPVATGTPVSGVLTFYVNDGVVKVPSDGNVKLTVKADINHIDGTTIAQGAALEVTVNADNTDVVTTGLSSGSTVNGGGSTNYDAATHKAYKSFPRVAFNASTPSGTLIPSSNTLAAKIDITAGAEDITFDQATNANSIILAIAAVNGTSDADEDVIVKDSDGNILCSTTTLNLGTTATFTCDFATNTLTVSAGTTETISVYVETTELTTAGNSLQIWLDDGNSGNNIDWAINNSGSYNEGDVIFRGDLYGGSLVKP